MLIGSRASFYYILLLSDADTKDLKLIHTFTHTSLYTFNIAVTMRNFIRTRGENKCIKSDHLRFLQISSGDVWQTWDLHLSCNMLYMFLCFFIVLKHNLFVYRDDSFLR